ncbi:sugar-transfer associated ATP-grasp domain-containing protein [Algibacter mikhailovii]|uniref:sugar-transfer associated ATP-grasp domain-containing protein n=1 Tax=Algibacter mikhailovii TaxID=425498 RepID=UPI002495A74B|nr:sugar-transfer associated ATP-grasp domain-containing protein [Algibacter mikhailovii]
MKEKLLYYSKQIISYAKKYNYNYGHNNMAYHALETIESIKGRTDPKLLGEAMDYAMDVLGWSGYAPWLQAYTAMSSEFREGWLPENYFGTVIVPKLQNDVGKTSFLKPLSKKLFNSSVFPDVGYFVNGSFYSKYYKPIMVSHVTEYLFKDSDRIVFKSNNSAQGMGVSVFTKNDFNYFKIKTLGDGVFQTYITPHAFFNAIMPNSVSTLRILTVLDQEGKASVRAVYLRVGRTQDSHVKSSTQISIPVHLETGALHALGYSKSWYTLDQHPDTGFVFKDQKIPYFSSFIKTARDLQQAMPFVKCIGWDMVLDCDNAIQVMQWNGFHTGIGFAEFTQGPCFKGLGWENLWKEKII